MVNVFPNILNTVNLDQIIAYLNKFIEVFLKAFPGKKWKNETTELRLKVVKMILKSMVKIKGQEVY